jgi:hypothetical protein
VADTRVASAIHNFRQRLDRRQCPVYLPAAVVRDDNSIITRRTILPRMWPASSCSWAFWASESGRTRETTGLTIPASISGSDEQVRSAILERSGPRSHSHPRVELLATIVSWAIYGAALEWSQRPGTQSAEAFVEEALPLIAASIVVFEDRTHYLQ